MAKWIYNNTQSLKTYEGQNIPLNSYYNIQKIEESRFANSSTLIIDIASSDAIISTTNDSTGHISDVNRAVDFLKDNLPREVQTRTERSDVSMKLCRHKVTTTSNTGTLKIKVPGTFGSSPGRLIAGGFAFFGNGVAGDYVDEINVVDDDNNLGAGAGYIVKSWHDDDVTSYQSSGLWLCPGENIIQSMGDWGEIPAGLYLEIKVVKKAGESDDTFYVTIIWGEES